MHSSRSSALSLWHTSLAEAVKKVLSVRWMLEGDSILAVRLIVYYGSIRNTTSVSALAFSISSNRT